jgi:hypothetical protein
VHKKRFLSRSLSLYKNGRSLALLIRIEEKKKIRGNSSIGIIGSGTFGEYTVLLMWEVIIALTVHNRCTTPRHNEVGSMCRGKC